MPVLTAFENIELPLLLTGLSSRERKQHVQRMEKMELVARCEAADDGRGVLAMLTDHGFSVLEKAAVTLSLIHI